MALVEGLELGEGTIDVDLKGLGEEKASFVGIAFGVATCSTAACWLFRPAGVALRLARGIALGVALFHFFLAPHSGTYGRWLLGSC